MRRRAGADPRPSSGRIHARVASVRADSLHKATTDLARRYETIVAEDLNVTGMISNRKLARAVSDQGFGTVRRMLANKTAREGGRLVVADRWYPSSKTCSECGRRKPSLTLAERTYYCDACGLVTGRDINAARNLLNLAASGAERQNACGALVRPRLTPGQGVVKQEPGASSEDKTGTVPAQAGAAVER
jgi:putative transposase